MGSRISELATSACDALGRFEDTAEQAARSLCEEANDLVREGTAMAVTVGTKVYNGLEIAAHETKMLGEGAVKGALLNPLNGVGQLINKTTGCQLPKLELSNDKEVSESWSGKAGEVAGSILGFIATDGAVAAVGGIKAGTAMSMAITGAIEGGVMRTSDSKKEGLDFVADRLKHAGVESATLATMGGVVGRLASTFEAASPWFIERAAESAMKYGIGGAAGGFVNAEASAILDKGRLATQAELEKSVFLHAAFGFGMGAMTEGVTTLFEALRPGFKVPELSESEIAANRSLIQKLMDISKDVTPEFVDKVVAGLEKIPQSVLKRLEAEGIRIKVGAKLLDLEPGLAGASPRGHEGGVSWAQLDGLYNPGNKSVVIAETYEVPGCQTQVRSGRCEGVARHEAGHGVDDALNTFSSSPEFMAAHAADVAQIPRAMHKALDYFIQAKNPTAGASEAFADLFALMHGGPCNRSAALRLSRNFPQSIKAIARKLDSVAAGN